MKSESGVSRLCLNRISSNRLESLVRIFLNEISSTSHVRLKARKKAFGLVSIIGLKNAQKSSRWISSGTSIFLDKKLRRKSGEIF